MNVQEREKGVQEIWKLFAETDRTCKETDEELKNLFKETDKRIGEMTGKWSRFGVYIMTVGNKGSGQECNAKFCDCVERSDRLFG